MNALPYQDTKPVGAAGFYTAINATFRFIQGRFGADGLRRYWEDIGTRYYRPVSDRWTAGGLAAVADYWRTFFAAEPGSDVSVTDAADHVEVEVRTCPMIAHLREQSREIVPCFCQHCYFVSEAIGRPAGVTVRVEGGGGSCRQRFYLAASAPAAQTLDAIKEVQS
ncbi:MAG: hypothetical protein H7A55_15130 [Verrucomicrobiaceae bacterium]|nr:hypothetical protein [Verrucomicrobiaceae bacterium]